MHQNFIENIAIDFEIFKVEAEIYDEIAQEALNESIILKHTTQNQPITTAEPEVLAKLDSLLQQAESAISDGSWSNAVAFATQLKQLTIVTIKTTLNQTYYNYIESAEAIIEFAEQNMKVKIIPAKTEVEIKAGDPVKMDLIVLSTGAPSGTYTLTTNSSWILLDEQEIDVREWKATTVPITIHLLESFDVEPGKYPVKLTLHLSGTDTITSEI
ncbi:MAG: hypothetical protein ACTSQ8_10305, partial [Candidatus Helarchaeota archaeon]